MKALPPWCCPEHPIEVLVCSCGYLAAQDLDSMPTIPWDQELMNKEWDSWPWAARQEYVELLAILKPFETEPLQAASIAARAVFDSGTLDCEKT